MSGYLSRSIDALRPDHGPLCAYALGAALDLSRTLLRAHRHGLYSLSLVKVNRGVGRPTAKALRAAGFVLFASARIHKAQKAANNQRPHTQGF